MRRVLAICLVLPACYGGERYGSGCPAGEICSAGTPTGLRFLPPPMFDMTPVFGPTPIAIGGTQTVQLVYDIDSFGGVRPLDLPYTADDGGGPAVRVANAYGATVTLRGDATGENEVRILDASDGTLFDRKMFSAGVLDRVELAPDTDELVTTTQVAYAIGLRKLGIRLFDAAGDRLYDTSLQLAGALRLEWDVAELVAPAAGFYSIAVTAGGATTSLPVAVADHADTIVQIDGLAAVPAYGTDVCFGAQLVGVTVVGFAWSFTIDGTPHAASPFHPDCVFVEPTTQTGTIDVQATAGGATLALVLPIGAAPRTVPAAPVAAPAPADGRGERAALAD